MRQLLCDSRGIGELATVDLHPRRAEREFTRAPISYGSLRLLRSPLALGSIRWLRPGSDALRDYLSRRPPDGCELVQCEVPGGGSDDSERGRLDLYHDSAYRTEGREHQAAREEEGSLHSRDPASGGAHRLGAEPNRLLAVPEGLPLAERHVVELSQAYLVIARAEAALETLAPKVHRLEARRALRAVQEAYQALFLRPSPHLRPELVPFPGEALEEEESLSAWDPDPLVDCIFDAEQIRTLLLDVMQRAAHDWVLYRTSSRMDHRELAYDAYVWLFEEGPGTANWETRKREGRELTSFLSICDILDVDPDFARAHIRKLTVRDVKMAGRPADRRHRQSLDTSYYDEHMVSTSVPDAPSWE